MTAVAAALSAMAVSGTEGLEEEEEEEEDECSVCLNAIDSNDNAANPAGPALRCGHRYHTFCLQFWVEKCSSKCIEPPLPVAVAGLGEHLRYRKGNRIENVQYSLLTRVRKCQVLGWSM